MKVTLNWLKEFVDFDFEVDHLVHALTMIGLEVEECGTLHYDFNDVRVGKIVDVQKNSPSDSLSLCKVDIGNGILSVVCGAPNTRKGMLVPTAAVGATLNKTHKVIAKEIHGVPSEGILLSEAELSLTDRADILMELPSDAPLGQNLDHYLGTPDVVLDIFITPNRADCLSVRGIAREIAAGAGTHLRKHPIRIHQDKEPVSESVSIDIRDIQKCARYSGQLIKNIQIEPSPFWMARRLYAVGIRAINNVVDITNYVMWETGQPLHAFDYRLLEGKKIIVRTARNGEKFATLDAKEHTLDDAALLICDGKKPVALAGIMGGLNSEVQSDTNTVFLEGAHFEPINIRMTAKKLGILTESSRRFERGVDPNETVYAIHRAAQLMQDLAHGTVAAPEADSYVRKIVPVEMDLLLQHVNNLLGTDLTMDDITKILPPLELKISRVKENSCHIQVPTFRPDLVKEVDLIEEIAIHIGYDNIPEKTDCQINQLQPANERVIFKDRIRTILAGNGLSEIVSFTLVPEKSARIFLPPQCELIRLVNPLSADLDVLRPGLLVSLLAAVAYNRNRQISDLALFELGNVAWDKEKYLEQTHVAGILAGNRVPQSWYDKARPFDFYDIKSVVINVLAELGIHQFEFRKECQEYWDSEAVALVIQDQIAGALGKIDQRTCAHFKIKTSDVYAFYLDVEILFSHRIAQRKFTPISRFPSIPFDLALVIDRDTPIGKIEQAIRSTAGENLSGLSLFDFYTGEQVQKDKKSVAFSLTFSSKERTLSEDEVNNSIQLILAHLKNLFGAELRPK